MKTTASIIKETSKYTDDQVEGIVEMSNITNKVREAIKAAIIYGYRLCEKDNNLT